jgi:hypothetical protein
MPFDVENEDNSIVKFTFRETPANKFSSDDMKKVLAIFTKLLERKKPFALYVDTRLANRPPLDAATMMIRWMRANRALSKQYLICTAVVFSNTTANIVAKNLIQGVFKIQPTVSPNLLTVDYDRCVKWIKDKVNEYAKIKNMEREIINEDET